MHSQIKEWLHHPVSQTLVKVITELRESAIQEMVDAPDDMSGEILERKRQRIKVLSEVLDFETLLDGEIE